MTELDSVLKKKIAELKRSTLFRRMECIDSVQGPTVTIKGKKIILLSSNNYLGLANHPDVIKAQIQSAEEFGAGTGASRLICGNMTLHEKLEKNLARFKTTESAILFPTGYMANIGTLSALAGEKDLVVCDKLNHASIIDGVRLSGARLRVYPHKNLKRLEDILKNSGAYEKRFIVTDGVFSMDGDIADLPKLVKIAQRFDAFLMVDDAHSTGVLGPTGRGTCEYFGIEQGIDIQMGTLSKALGNMGGYIAGSNTLIEYIRNKARPFIYSTALSPAVIGGCIKALEIVEKSEGTRLRERLCANVRKLRNALIRLGFDTMDSQTQIIPVCMGDSASTMKTAEKLLRNGIFAPGIRPPTVPKTKCRIRISLMATHTDEHIDRIIDIFGKIRRFL